MFTIKKNPAYRRHWIFLCVWIITLILGKPPKNQGTNLRNFFTSWINIFGISFTPPKGLFTYYVSQKWGDQTHLPPYQSKMEGPAPLKGPQNHFLPLSHFKCFVKVPTFLLYKLATKRTKSYYVYQIIFFYSLSFGLDILSSYQLAAVTEYLSPTNFLSVAETFSVTEIVLWPKLFFFDGNMCLWR